MAKQQKKIGEILAEWQLVNPKDVARALEHAKKGGMRIGEAMVEMNMCTEGNVYKALAAQQNMDYVELDRTQVTSENMQLIPDDLMRKYIILPLGLEGGRLKIAVHDPLDLEMLDILRFRLHKEIRTALAPRNRIKKILDERFQTTAANTIDKTMEKTMDRSMDKSLDKSMDKTVDKSIDRSIDKSIDLSG